MDKFTKEQQVQAVYDLKVGYTLGHADIAMLKSMARQLLSSMEQEPVAWIGVNMLKDMQDECRQSGRVWVDDTGLGNCTPLYAAPQLPQPAVLSVSEGVLKSLLPDVEKSEFWFEHNGKIFFEGVRFNNAVFEACRAAMLQAEPVSNSDELPLDYLQGHKDGLEWAAQLAEANHPQTGDWLYDDPIELARAIRKGPDIPEFKSVSVDEDDNFYSWFGRFWYENYQKNNYTTSAKQMLGTMAEFAYRAGRESAALAANSPVTPDGWQLVPKEPTEAMNKAGWAAINEHDAINPTYRAMLAAAPQQDVRLALEIGMSRYAGAMQKLVDSGD
ncbi:hypothetical protein [Enterobacter asburiae]|uniref:hypothetical protein n=1 Tax=Enterobacter asburiae TaxID=61645 RepID=UPI002073E1B4|nr:hypothetical protein [Enterobacter asburiae]